jgi:hypothetical protein
VATRGKPTVHTTVLMARTPSAYLHRRGDCKWFRDRPVYRFGACFTVLPCPDRCRFLRARGPRRRHDVSRTWTPPKVQQACGVPEVCLACELMRSGSSRSSSSPPALRRFSLNSCLRRTRDHRMYKWTRSTPIHIVTRGAVEIDGELPAAPSCPQSWPGVKAVITSGLLDSRHQRIRQS